MWRQFLLVGLGMASMACAAEDGWTKVKALASGTELRIGITGSKTPLLATMDQATEDSLIVATKKEQISIEKLKIEKIEFRPVQKGSRLKSETLTDNTPVNREAARPGAGPARTPGPMGSSSSSVTLGGKADFEVLWVKGRRN